MFDIIKRKKLSLSLSGDKEFPYHLLVKRWDSDLKVLRYMVAPWGSDLNEGLNWDSPKRQIQNIIDELPENGNYNQIFILVHGGDYEGFNLFNHYNYIIHILPIGDWIESSDDYSKWCKNNSIRQITDDSKIIFHLNNEKHLINVKYNELIFEAGYNYAGPELGRYFGKIKFDCAAGEYSPIKNSGKLALFFCEFDFSQVTGYTVIESIDGNKYLSAENLLIEGGRFIGNPNAEWANRENVWYRACISGRNNSTIIEWLWWNGGLSGVIFKPNYQPASGKHLEIINIRQFYSDWFATDIGLTNESCKIKLDEPLAIYYDGSGLTGAPTKFKLYFEEGFKGNVTYHSDIIQLYDKSSAPHYIKDAKINKVSRYVSNLIKSSDDNIYKVRNTEIADTDLSNGELVFYTDEATDKLMVKYKDTAGVVFHGNVALL